ncbi:FUSC family protein [Streptomyces abyssomicinicus]|uniref:FUSC family protein n=1 Tax=Streptomyces abyssomicinicus TaxID=574929 RepID=UPI00124FBEFE|nr:FUSC family protein [Streptomyces abyssomicinicus]
MTGAARARAGWAAFRDRVAASDPGLLRLTAGLRTVSSLALTLGVVGVFGAQVEQLVAGAMAAMVATFAVREKEWRGQALSLTAGLPVAWLALTLGTLLSGTFVGVAVFVVLIFGAVYCRRFGDRGFALGMIAFQSYFLSQFLGVGTDGLVGLYWPVGAGFACSALIRFGVVQAGPEQVLGRLRAAFRARFAQLVSAQIDLLDAGPDQIEKALDHVRGRTARLHETAMMIQGRLTEGTPDDRAASLVQRRIADAEIAAERLGLLILTARSAERADTLTLHLPGAVLPESGLQPVRDRAVEALHRDLRALRTLVLRSTGEHRSTGLNQVRNRLLGYRDDDKLPAQASAAVRDVFRGVGEAARAVMGLRIALGGSPADETDDSPETARSREEIEAEDAAIAGAETVEDEREAERTGLDRPTTRTAVQVTVGSVLAIAGGDLLSQERWYWAVLACWIVFVNTSSTGEILVKAYRRLLGTMLGVVAGIVLAGLVGQRVELAFALVLVLVFLTHYLARLSYTLMSFFVTAMLGLLYTLLNTYSFDVLVLRLGETALGAACGLAAAVLILPVRTARRTDELLVTVLERLADVTRSAVHQLSGGPPADLLDQARELDEALGDLRSSTQPLTHPITPMRGRRNTARYVVAQLETCAYHARSLAATAELLPSQTAIAADPRLAGAGERIVRNIETIAAHVEERKDAGELESGASIASLLEPGSYASPRYGRVTDRVLRHLGRLDDAVTGLARPLQVPLRSRARQDHKTA